jgi:cytochrome c-type biogenesis protein CcmH
VKLMVRAGWQRCLLLSVALALSAGAALAVEPDEILPDPGLEARARGISAGLRCLVCQNQSIDDSNAPLARDLRLLVRERLKAGDSDAQVVQFVEDRYGEFVLLNPPLSWRTVLLWLAPLLALLVAVWVSARAWRRRQLRSGAADAAAAPLTPDEEAKLRKILADNADVPPAGG